MTIAAIAWCLFMLMGGMATIWICEFGPPKWITRLWFWIVDLVTGQLPARRKETERRATEKMLREAEHAARLLALAKRERQAVEHHEWARDYVRLLPPESKTDIVRTYIDADGDVTHIRQGYPATPINWYKEHEPKDIERWG